MIGDKSEAGHCVRLSSIHVGSEVWGAEELEETLVTDGPSLEPGLIQIVPDHQKAGKEELCTSMQENSRRWAEGD